MPDHLAADLERTIEDFVGQLKQQLIQPMTAPPVWLVKAALALVRLFSKRYDTIATGITTITQHASEASKTGTHRLKEFYEQIAPKP
jgi:hypothetical protein